MRSSLTLALAASLLSAVDAIRLAQRDPADSKTLYLPIRRREVADPVAHDRLRRRQSDDDGTLELDLDNQNTLYVAEASLGTPPQKLNVHIDTGSSDLWANTPDSTLCQRPGGPCDDGGTYAANDSSSYEFVSSEFEIRYADGSRAVGDYARDTFNLAGQDVEGLQFGIGYRSSSRNGILGIGYVTNEAIVARAGGQTYDNLPALLKKDGVIAANAYSLWLNDLDASTGSILFGGVDTYKYHGSLSTLPIVRPRGGAPIREFILVMTGMGLNGEAESIFGDRDSHFQSERIRVPVLLDSGSSLTYLPSGVADLLYTRFDARYIPRVGVAVVSCDLADQQGTVDFSFSGVTIKVDLNEMVVPLPTTRGPPICAFGVAPTQGRGLSVLGDTFLRSAYVVYDLENDEISLGQTNFAVGRPTGSNIMAIQPGPAGVPDAVGVPNAVATASQIPTGGARNGLPTDLDGSEIGTSSGLAPGLPRATGMAGVGLGLAAGLVALAV